MTRLMYDSTNAADIPPSAEMVAGYIDGRYRWLADDWLRFPDAVKVRIAVFASTNDGHMLDVEQGDATPEEAPGWVVRRRAAGVEPTVYVNRANWQAVRAAFAAADVREPYYLLAAYDGVAEIPMGTVGKQYANEDITGAHYDLSAVLDVWPGVDEEDGMTDEQVRAIVADYLANKYGPALEAELVQRLSDNSNADVGAAIAGAVRAVGAKLAA